MVKEMTLYVDDFSFVEGYGQTNSLDTILHNIGVINQQALEEYKAGLEKVGAFTFAEAAGKYVCVAFSNTTEPYSEMRIYDTQHDPDKFNLEHNYRTTAFVNEIRDAFKKAKTNDNSIQFNVVIGKPRPTS